MRALKLFFLSSLLLLASCSPSFAGGSVFGVTVVTTGGGGSGTIQADNDDIRFASGTTVLNHWIRTRSGAGTATVYVKFPTLAPGNNTQYYFYYNNPDAVDTGSFSITFTKDYQETGLVALWHLDEGTGLPQDSSGNAHNATDNRADWVGSDGGQWDGQAETNFNTGNSLNFTAANADWVDFPDSDAWALGGTFTIELWVRFNATNGQMLFSQGAPDNTNRYYWYYDGADSLDFHVVTGGGQVVGYNQPWTIVTNQWFHLAIVRNATNFEMFSNSVSLGTFVDADPIGNYTGVFRLASETDIGGQTLLNGRLDEIRIYNNRRLSINEIQSHYERRKYSASAVTITYGTEETGSWALDGVTFSNRRPLTVNNSGATTLTDFQVKFQFKVGASGTFVIN